MPPIDRIVDEKVLCSFLNNNDIVKDFIKWIVSGEIEFLLKEGCFFHPKAVPGKIEKWLNAVFKEFETEYQELEQLCQETLFTSLPQHKVFLEEIRVDLRNLFVVFTGEIITREQDTKGESEMNGLRADAVQIHKTKGSDRIKKEQLANLPIRYTNFILQTCILRDLIGNAKDIFDVVKSSQR